MKELDKVGRQFAKFMNLKDDEIRIDLAYDKRKLKWLRKMLIWNTRLVSQMLMNPVTYRYFVVEYGLGGIAMEDLVTCANSSSKWAQLLHSSFG